jgi:integrase
MHTKEELPVFLAGCEHSPFGLEALLMLMLGLRRGKALGLRFEDVDFENGTAHIQQQYTTCGKDESGKQQWGIRSLKTKESDRIVGMPALLLEKLAERKKEVDGQKSNNHGSYHDLGLICCNGDGTPRKIITVEHGFKRLLKENGLSDMRLHDLRHTYATLLLDQNVDLKTISQMLGHTSIKTTADIYISRNKDAAFRAAKAIECLFSSQISPNTTQHHPIQP